MADVVAGISMSHAPGLLGWSEEAPSDMNERIYAAIDRIKQYLDDAKPDVIIAFLDDHFENQFRNLLPTFSIGVASSHFGPAEAFLEVLRFEKTLEIPSSEDLASHLLYSLVPAGFDVARMGSVEFGNNLMLPLKFIREQYDIPVVPIFTNVFSPPLTTCSRTFDFGKAIRDCLKGRKERVCFLATGGLSHWPPIWKEDSPEDIKILQRMKRYQTEGKAALKDDPNIFMDVGMYEIEMAKNSTVPLINPDWDNKFLKALAEGDVDYMRSLTYDDVERDGGNGGHEIFNWIALMGAMDGAKANVLNYEPVNEYICGMAFAIYDI